MHQYRGALSSLSGYTTSATCRLTKSLKKKFSDGRWEGKCCFFFLSEPVVEWFVFHGRVVPWAGKLPRTVQLRLRHSTRPPCMHVQYCILYTRAWNDLNETCLGPE
jgi:hypothetical protein